MFPTRNVTMLMGMVLIISGQILGSAPIGKTNIIRSGVGVSQNLRGFAYWRMESGKHMFVKVKQ